ncbi:unnamed protein product [Closterium sp. NIES-53]
MLCFSSLQWARSLLACEPTCFRCCPVCRAPRDARRFFLPATRSERMAVFCPPRAQGARVGFLPAAPSGARVRPLPSRCPSWRPRGPARAPLPSPIVALSGARAWPPLPSPVVAPSGSRARPPPHVARRGALGGPRAALPSRRPSWCPQGPARGPRPVARRGALGARALPLLQLANCPCHPRAAPVASCPRALVGWRVWGWRVCEPSPPPPPPSPTAAAAAEGGGGVAAVKPTAPVARETVAPVAREPVAPVAREPVAPVAHGSAAPAA